MTKGGFSVCHRKKHFILPPNLLPKWEVTYWEFIYNNRLRCNGPLQAFNGF